MYVYDIDVYTSIWSEKIQISAVFLTLGYFGLFFFLFKFQIISKNKSDMEVLWTKYMQASVCIKT